ncbi:tetratricopeptide repeat-containing sensor histidine kinase [Flavobacteriaceae bacterium GSB9]|nr:tetratricopeptide repeat-containing sensor histidine kinase [Flavobacteriaceae bacterium GSB9]
MRRIITLFMLLFISVSFSQANDNDIDSLTIKLAFQEQDSLKVDTSLKLIKSLYDINDFDRALKYIIESEKLSHALNYTEAIAEITYYKSLIYAHKGDYINAVSGYNKSKSLFNQLKDTLGVAKVNNSIGLIEIKRGNYAKGLQFSLSAINELERRNLTKDLNLAYSNLAKAYYNINAYDNAIEFYLKALEKQKILNDVKGINESHLKLAELFSNRKEHRKAIDYYQKVLQSSSLNDSLRSVILPKLGGEYLKFNDYGNATTYLVQSYNLNHSNNTKLGMLLTLNNLGDLNIRQNRFKTAEKQLQEAGELAKALDNKIELLKHYKLLKTLDSTRGQFNKAFVWQREYYELNKALKKNEAVVDQSPAKHEGFNFNSETTPSQKITETDKEAMAALPKSEDRLGKFKLIFYGLLAALAIVSTFLVLIYLKRNSNIKYMQELEEKNIKIELQNEAFLEQTKHLENVNNVKDKLFSIVSHDLKDSLSSINGFIDLLRDGSLSREEFDNLIPELSENANNASLLLFNLLNWSKSQMQSLAPKPTLFDVQEVFEEKVKLIEPRMENKGITLVDHSLRDFAYADRSMVEIVIQNLLANALKFCNRGDSITISNHISNGSCIISIADTGVGISKQNLEKLFKNSSFTTRGTDNEKGTGLGLSICKELVELNNGKIWVESTQGVGSTFYVQLPKSKPSD